MVIVQIISTPHNHHIEWLRSIDYRTKIGRRLKEILGTTSSIQCKKFLKKSKLHTLTEIRLKNLNNFIVEEYPKWESQQRSPTYNKENCNITFIIKSASQKTSSAF